MVFWEGGAQSMMTPLIEMLQALWVAFFPFIKLLLGIGLAYFIIWGILSFIEGYAQKQRRIGKMHTEALKESMTQYYEGQISHWTEPEPEDDEEE
jgi:hypothetical protein